MPDSRAIPTPTLAPKRAMGDGLVRSVFAEVNETPSRPTASEAMVAAEYLFLVFICFFDVPAG